MLLRARYRGAGLAGATVVAALLLPLAPASAAVTADGATGAPAVTAGAGHSPLAAQWLRTAVFGPYAGAARIGVKTGDYKSCPKLPAGYKRGQFTCVIAHITGGKLIIGQSRQQITKPLTITYANGTAPNGQTTAIWGSLKAKPIELPGGIFLSPKVNSHVKNDPKAQLRMLAAGVGAAPDPSGAGTGYISMRLKAINPIFGKTCWIGSTQDPVVVDPTFGTTNPPPPNKPIHGHIDKIINRKTETIVLGTLVDNAFAAPAAQGCGPNSMLDPLINGVAALPSPAGTNTAIFKATLELVPYTHVTSSSRARS